MDIMQELWYTRGYVKTIEDKIGCKYSEINTNMENRINTVTSIAAITRGKNKSKNPKKRIQGLLKEAAANICFYRLEELDNQKEVKEDFLAAGRPLEYCPVVVKRIIAKDKVFIKDIETGTNLAIMGYRTYENKLSKFGFIQEIDGEELLFTNARALVNIGIPFDLIPFNTNEELMKHYFIVEVKAPYFVFAQMRTHGLLSQVAVSERVLKEDEAWLPNDFIYRFLNYINKFNPDDLGQKLKQNRLLSRLYNLFTKAKELDQMLPINDKENIENLIIRNFKSLPNILANEFTIDEVQELLKELNYHQEIVNRWYNHMKFKTWIIGGWLNNPYQWGHFLLERGAYDFHGAKTQQQTREVAEAIREIINLYIAIRG